MKTAHGDENGFTLIELMIVMVVLAILASIALMGVTTFQSDSEASRDGANDRQCAEAFAAYAAQHAGTDPTAFSQISSYFRTVPSDHCGI